MERFDRPPAAHIWKQERGFALLLTLLVVLLLAIIIFEMDFQARADLRAAWNFRDALAAHLLAASGMDVAKHALKEDAKNQDTNRMDWPGELWATPIENYPVRDGVISAKITDEASKININMLVKNPHPPLNALRIWRLNQLRLLFQRLEIDPHLVDPIADWIDSDNETEAYGAENDFYQYLDPPYSARNGPMENLQELLFVKGITREEYKKMLPYLTLYSPQGLLNVNTAEPVVLQSLHESINEETAQQMAHNRPYDHPDKVNQIANLPTGTKNPIPGGLLTVRSDIFSMEITGTVHETKKKLRAVWDRRNEGKLLYFQVE